MRFAFLWIILHTYSILNVKAFYDLFSNNLASSQCEKKCSSVFNKGLKEPPGIESLFLPAHKELWSTTSSCQQGCRFYGLAQVMSSFGMEGGEARRSCHDTCRDAHILLTHRRACQKGCQEMAILLPKDTEPEGQETQFDDLSSFGTNLMNLLNIVTVPDLEKSVSFEEKELKASGSSDNDDVVQDELDLGYSDAETMSEQAIAHVWIRTMPLSSNPFLILREVPSEIDGDFQNEDVKDTWYWRSCLSGRSGLPDWALVLLLTGAFVCLAYLGWQGICGEGERQKIGDVVYISQNGSNYSKSDLEHLLTLRRDDLDTEFVKKPLLTVV